MAGCSIAEVLTANRLEPLEARILLGHALGLTRVQLVTGSERILDEDETVRVNALFESRRAGVPVAYLTGEREFYGLSFMVTPAVLIPRPDTELLVELALQRLPRNGFLLDLGTGSGIVAIAAAHSRPDASVSAVDISAEALDVARHNATRHGVQVDFMCSDWYAAIPPRRFDVIAANPPYIVAGDAHLSQGDLRHEPLSALTDHGNGLSALLSIIADAGDFLKPGGWLLMEHGYNQAQAVRDLLSARGGFNAASITSWRDLAGIERVTAAQFDA